MDAQGRVRVQGRRLGDEALANLVAERVASDSNSRAMIAADGAVAHQHVVHVMDLLRGQHLTQVAIAVTPSH